MTITRKKALLALALPTLGALVLLAWSLLGGIMIMNGFQNGTWNIKGFLESMAFMHVSVLLFTIPIYAWIPASLSAYGIGVWLVLLSAHQARRVPLFVLGMLLSLLPSILIALYPFCKCRGP